VIIIIIYGVIPMQMLVRYHTAFNLLLKAVELDTQQASHIKPGWYVPEWLEAAEAARIGRLPQTGSQKQRVDCIIDLRG
jgi:hypothetical protein